MIGGAPRRGLSREVSKSWQPAFEQLQLPWLCPAIYNRAQLPPRPQIQRRATANVSNQRPAAPSRMQTSPATVSYRPQQKRQYAYTAAPGTHDQVDDSIPIENPLFATTWTQKSTDLPYFDPSNPLIVEEQEDERSDFLKQHISYWEKEDLIEVHKNLEAYLAVGLNERAAAAMRFLNSAYKLDRPEVLRVNNYYIGHLLAQFNTTGDQELLQYGQKWLHVDMIRKDISPNAATYALMIQLVMRDENIGRGARSVRRYATLAEQDGILDAVREELLSRVPNDEYLQLTDMEPRLFNQTVEMTPEMEQDADHAEYQQVVDSIPDLAASSVPEITGTKQKGSGLFYLHQSLSSLSDPELSKTHINADTLQTAANIDRQRRLEQDSALTSLERWRVAEKGNVARGNLHTALRVTRVREMAWEWHQKLVPLLRAEIDKMADVVSRKIPATTDVEPYLRFIPVENLSAIAVSRALNMVAHGSATKPIPVVRLVVEIGKYVEQESTKEWTKARQKNQFTKAEPSQEAHSDNPSRKYTLKEGIFTGVSEPPRWSAATRAKAGAILFAQLMKVAIMPPVEGAQKGSDKAVYRPAFAQRLDFWKGRRTGVVTCDTELVKSMSFEPGLANINKQMPMLVEPKPWSGWDVGGYLVHRTPVVRFATVSFQSKSYIELAVRNGDMKQALRGLDVLGKVPWKINKDVFEVMAKVWNSGEALAKIPAANYQDEMPQLPPPNAPLDEVRRYRAHRLFAENKKKGFHSNRCYQNFQMEVARAYINDTFYLPHNMDFRGRAYPLPSYLNQMGADNCRGLLMFANGKKLGAKGLDWLKVHLANVYGFDKASLSERRKFAETHMDDILDSVEKPLEGRRWWLDAEDPWQCLATCFELSKALSLPDPTEYISHLPVHQDGTCNGLQHYAALGGDEIGAKQVNLEPGDKPSDIYSGVADLVKSYVTEDAAAGVEMAKLLDGKIVRKVVKQTVMTNVYGVTFQGARMQVARQLQALYPETFGPTEVQKVFLAATYISKHIFGAMSTIFNGASAIQEWLGQCAARICESLTPEQVDILEQEHAAHIDGGSPHPTSSRRRSKGDAFAEASRFRSTIIWTTPLRMPVVQPYRATRSKRVKTVLQDISVEEQCSLDTVEKRKQLQAFPPNFIHSLDACHMLLSAIKCSEAGLNFAAVHDSFWTHAADVDAMNVTLRNAFVDMHQEDIVKRLASEFEARYKNCWHLSHVDRRSPLGKRITAYRRTQANTDVPRNVLELLAERTRLKYLASEDPEIRKQGESMVTPGSLYMQATAEDHLAPPSKRKQDDIKAEAAAATSGPFTNEPPGSESLFDQSEMSDYEDMGEQMEYMSQLETEAATSGAHESENDPSNGADSKRSVKQKRASAPGPKVSVWLPLTFPPVPAKGSWDVTRLKQSTYFFS